jgi:hypothetical protein
MTFPIGIFAGGLALLLQQLALLFLDPRQFRNREHAHRIQAHSLGGGNPHPSSWRMDAQMDVLNILSNNIDANVTELNSRAHQYSC